MKWNIKVGVLLLMVACIMTGCKQAEKKEESNLSKQEQQKEDVSNPSELPIEIQKEEENNNDQLENDQKELPVPISGLYQDMVVEKMDYVPLEENEKVAYITFDDGPCKSTKRLLEILKDHNVKATFFVTAQYGTDEEIVEWLKEIKAEGHEIGVHSYSHYYKEIYSSVKSYLKDFKKMDDLIVEATGEHSRIFRFPGGSNTGYNASVREDIIKEMTSRGMVYYDWNAYNGDCDGASKTEMVEKAVRESSYKNKSIVLMHNIPAKDQVIEVLPKIISPLRKKGYEFHALDGTVEPIQFVKANDVVKEEPDNQTKKEEE